MSPRVEPANRSNSQNSNGFRRACAVVGAVLFAGGWAGAADPTPVPPPPATRPDPKADDPKFKCDKFVLNKDRFDYANIEDDAPVKGEDENNGHEFRSYNDIVLQVRQFPTAELEQCARKNLTFRDLVKDVRRDYQFDLVYFEGRLKSLREAKPNKPLAEAGVKTLYEAWVFPTDAADPMCVVFTELPEGLTPANEYAIGKPVRFAGYSFKLMRYESKAPNKTDPTRGQVRRAPLILAKTLTLIPVPDVDAGKNWREGFIPGLLALLGSIVTVTLGLTWWFRRGERGFRREREARYDTQNPFAAPADGAGPGGPTGQAGPPGVTPAT